MKKVCSLILILILLLSLSGCRGEAEADTTPTENAPEEVLPSASIEPTQSETETLAPETEAPAETTENETEATTPATQPPADTSYLQKVTRADQSIFDGPSYDHIFVGTVEVAGTYTIVEEVQDAEGNLWGRLKSGVGWIDLTDVRSDAPRPVTANYADETLLRSGNYHHCAAYPVENAVQVAIRAYEVLRDVTFYSMEFVEDDYQAAELLYSIDEMQPDMPLVVDVEFPGDMTMYGLHFTDRSGATHTCCIYISGRNGALILTEETQ